MQTVFCVDRCVASFLKGASAQSHFSMQRRGKHSQYRVVSLARHAHLFKESSLLAGKIAMHARALAQCSAVGQ